jgi:hypothetical protein
MRFPARGRSSVPATCSTQLERLDGKPAGDAEVERLLASVDATEVARQASAGVGRDLRLRGAEVIGSGLEVDEELVQLSAFRSEDGGRRAFGRIARPSVAAEPSSQSGLRYVVQVATTS